MAADNNPRCRVWQTGVIRLLLSCPRTDSGEVLSGEPFDQRTSRTCSGIIAKIAQPRRRINSYEEEMLLKGAAGSDITFIAMFSERVLIIVRWIQKDKNDPKKMWDHSWCVFLRAQRTKTPELRLVRFLTANRRTNRAGRSLFQMLLHAHLTSYQEPRKWHPCQFLAHSAIPDATQDLLATAVNAFKFPSRVVRWHRMTFGPGLLFFLMQKNKSTIFAWTLALTSNRNKHVKVH